MLELAGLRERIQEILLTYTGIHGGVPPVLAPSVEESYRRKCIQLKQRINELEHDNDSVQLRVTRLEHGVQKIRLERAFLLEQLAKRTSTNVEDSDGSPSPPPTVSPKFSNNHLY